MNTKKDRIIMLWERIIPGLTRGLKDEKPDLRSGFATQIARIIFADANESPQNIWRNCINFVDIIIIAPENGNSRITCTIKKDGSEQQFKGTEKELAKIIEDNLDRDIKCIVQIITPKRPPNRL